MKAGDGLTLEEETLKENQKIMSKAERHLQNVLNQLAQNAVDKAEFSVGGKREGKYKVSDIPQQDDRKFSVSDNFSSKNDEKLSIEEKPGAFLEKADVMAATPESESFWLMKNNFTDGKLISSGKNSLSTLSDTSSFVSVQKREAVANAEKEEENKETAGAYNKNRYDMTAIANVVLEGSKASYQSTDFSGGKLITSQYGALLGAGSISRHAAFADIKTQLYDRDKIEISMAQNAINNWERENGSKVTYKTLSMDTAHSRVVNNFADNQMLIDSYLKGHGINTRGMKVRDIDKMIGMQDRKYYGNTSNFHAGQSKFFNGKFRDSIAGTTPGRSSTGTSWAGNMANGGIPITDDMRAVLMEKRFLLEMSPKVRQAAYANGGIVNTGRAWIQQGTQDTDANSGYQYARSIGTGAKAVATAGEGATALAGNAMVRSIEATGRVTAAVGKKAIDLGGKIYAHGNIDRMNKWTTNTQNARLGLDRMSSVSKTIGREGSRAINKTVKATVRFTNSSGLRKAKIISGEIERKNLGDSAKWLIDKTIGKTKNGKKVKKIGGKIVGITKSVSKKIATAQLAIYKHTKLIRAPFSLYNKFQRMSQKLIIGVGLSFAGLCLIVVIVLTPVAAFTAIIPDAFIADDSYSITNSVGQEAVKAMLETQQQFKTEVENYYDATCTLTDENGNKLHPHHSAYFSFYYGSNSNEYDDLVNPKNLKSNQSISVLYKTIISMATVATGNEAEDKDFYINYCTTLLNKILHTASYKDVGGTVPINLWNCSLVDGMNLDSQNITCIINPCGCSRTFPVTDNAWMHNYGKDSLEYSEWLRTSKNYNTWDGWITDNHANYEWARALYDLEDEDWPELNVILPGSDDFTGKFSGKALTTDQIEQIMKWAQNSTDDPERLAVIQSALEAYQLGILYSQGRPQDPGPRGNTRNKGDGLGPYQDCSSFCWNNLVNAGIVKGSNWAYSTASFAGDPHSSRNVTGHKFQAGDVMVKYNGNGSNHAIMFLGYTDDGKPVTIECGGGYSRLDVFSYNDISIKTYDSVSSMISTRGSNYVCDFF